MPLALYYFLDGEAPARDRPHAGQAGRATSRRRRRGARRARAAQGAGPATSPTAAPRTGRADRPRDRAPALAIAGHAARHLLPLQPPRLRGRRRALRHARATAGLGAQAPSRRAATIERCCEATSAGWAPKTARWPGASVVRAGAARLRLPPRRAAADPQAAGRGALQPRPDAGRLRHRHPGAGRSTCPPARVVDRRA